MTDESNQSALVRMQPSGAAKTALRDYRYGLAITSQFHFCGLPLRLDTYSRCAFRCSYCFAHARGGADRGGVSNVYSSDRLAKRFERVKMGIARGAVDEFLAHGQPIHFGGMADPFSSLEKKYRASLSALAILADAQHPTVISTKSDMLADDRYLSILQKGRFLVQVSISSMDDRLIAKIDKGTPGPKRLFAMLRALHAAGIPTACRIQPLLPGLEAHAEEVIEASCESGVRHVAVEHLKLGIEKQWQGTSQLGEVLGIDLFKYFQKHHAQRIGREWVLHREARLGRTIAFRKLVHARGITFGAADTDLLLLSDGGCCCSGADRISGFENYFKFNYVEAARVGLRSGIVSLGNLSGVWAPGGSIAEYVNSHSRLPSGVLGGANIAEYVAANWNGVANGPSPSTLFGLIDAGELDDYGNKTYEISPDLHRVMNA